MKKLLVMALLSFIVASAKSQSITLISSNPWFNNDHSYASHPTVTLDSISRQLHYSFTVNYPMTNRSNIEYGGTMITLGLVMEPYGTIEYLEFFDNETSDYTTLPFGPVTHSGTVDISIWYNHIRLVFISAGTSFSYFNDPYHPQGYQTYDEYEFIR